MIMKQTRHYRIAGFTLLIFATTLPQSVWAQEDSEAADAIKDEADQKNAEVEQQHKDASSPLSADSSGSTADDRKGDTASGGDRGGRPVDAVAEKKDQLLVAVTGLQEERTALTDRLEVVLASLELKGGKVEQYRTYANAVSGIDLDATDASAT